MTQADSTPVLGRSLEETSEASQSALAAGPAYSPYIYTPVRHAGPTVQEEPIDLGEPNKDAVPAKDCKICAALVKQRDEARRVFNWSKASDCNIEIFLHPHEGRPLGVD